MSRARGLSGPVRRAPGAVGAALLACAVLAAPAAAQAQDLRPTAKRAVVARLVIGTDARERAGAGAVKLRLAAQTPWNGGPVRLLVLGGQRDAAGALWLRVRLPSRPNTASGWVPADHALLSVTGWRVVVHTRSRRVSIYRSGKLVRRFAAVVGAASTPTPHGLFAIWEANRQPDPAGFLGPWALHLTAHSDVLENFGGGAGRVAIHGRGPASLRDPLGTARSHGCVRIDNHQIRWLARTLAPGTPVRVAP